MTPLRAAVLLALEQACRAYWPEIKSLPGITDSRAVSWAASVSNISSRVDYPGLVRSSTIRTILRKERDAGRVVHDPVQFGVHHWWPVGLVDKLRAEQAAS